MDAIEVLKQATIKGNVVILPPGQLDRKLYEEVAKKLDGIGGKWNKKHGGFWFSGDPTDLIAKVCGGDKINLKKEFQFFPTPPDIAAFMANELYLRDGDTLLEPSAGHGDLIDAVLKEGYSDNDVFYIEKNLDNIRHLSKKYGDHEKIYHIVTDGHDFLKYDCLTKFDRIIANPPFSKNQDIDHIFKMWECLAPGGRIVTVASKHWQFANGKKEKAFKGWIDTVDATVYDLDSGAFKQSGTMVKTVVLSIDKPKE